MSATLDPTGGSLIIRRDTPATGSLVTVYRDLTGTVPRGWSIRIIVEGYVIDPTGQVDPRNVASGITWNAGTDFLDSVTEYRAPRIGEPYQLDNGSVRTWVSIAIQGRTREAWADAETLRGAIKNHVTVDPEDNAIGFDPSGEGGVYLTDLGSSPEGTIVNRVQSYETAPTSEFVKETIREQANAIGSVVGSAVTGAVEGATGGIVSGLSWPVLILGIGLIFLGLLVVWFVYLR